MWWSSSRLALRRKLSFKAALNNAIRAGFAAERGGSRAYRAPARPMWLRPGVDLSHDLQMAEALEVEESVRKLELGSRRGWAGFDDDGDPCDGVVQVAQRGTSLRVAARASGVRTLLTMLAA